jgi:hypothetical protein
MEKTTKRGRRRGRRRSKRIKVFILYLANIRFLQFFRNEKSEEEQNKKDNPKEIF